jgi:hypothetical protein
MEFYCPGILENYFLGEILSRRSKWTGKLRRTGVPLSRSLIKFN